MTQTEGMQAALMIMDITSIQKNMSMAITMKANLALEAICLCLRLQKQVLSYLKIQRKLAAVMGINIMIMTIITSMGMNIIILIKNNISMKKNVVVQRNKAKVVRAKEIMTFN